MRPPCPPPGGHGGRPSCCPAVTLSVMTGSTFLPAPDRAVLWMSQGTGRGIRNCTGSLRGKGFRSFGGRMTSRPDSGDEGRRTRAGKASGEADQHAGKAFLGETPPADGSTRFGGSTAADNSRVLQPSGPVRWGARRIRTPRSTTLRARRHHAGGPEKCVRALTGPVTGPRSTVPSRRRPATGDTTQSTSSCQPPGCPRNQAASSGAEASTSTRRITCTASTKVTLAPEEAAVASTA